MPKINCGVTNCSHNNKRVCYANIINVAGASAHDEFDTSCTSFLDSLVYSDLTNNVNQLSSSCSAITCDADDCSYNSNKLCNADSIMVSGNNANLYLETNCSTFKLKY